MVVKKSNPQYSRGIGGGRVISFKPRKMNEETLIEQLKKVFDHCDADDYKTKKFKGLLYDYIPNEVGLKTRLEVMGQTGTLEKLIKTIKKKPLKLQKLSEEFALIYGFSMEATYQTMTLVAKALDAPVLSLVPDVSKPIVAAVKTQGNFSKKHLESDEAAGAKAPTQNRIPNKRMKRKNPWHLLAVIGFAALMCSGLVAIMSLFSDQTMLIEAFKSVSSVGVKHPWFIATIATTVLMATLPKALYRFKKINVPSLYPVTMLLIQLVSAALYVTLPQTYEMIQIGIWLALSLSFGALVVPAIKLPIGYTDAISCKAIVPYYLTAISFFASQYLVRHFL